ncbi:MAG: hypothetical protein G01um101448_290 [Parcubacteria group bacterium Gr01-1014_48]|nr:MAG: hypothetical protein Greene041614_608 [Parcubacteria group bacterium Greene0416_14]TSC74180.1 MAG: hypothetical protein G01um101448_290 [Parcubacteria group bacterium Gr01-1014_48]TSD00856.1 MAG: hypothetical protein Greene101415_657 [Parcubacteria group bacterium Greene1014_15]TSD07938.1 MAG: hypothetical protein Greene07144_568 [Parcubacteria group bacterium Greene0714_4]
MDNQTKKGWLKGVSSDALGTGVFLIPDVESSIPYATLKKLVPNITYADCMQRGKRTVAFQWVPHTIKTYEELAQAVCACRNIEKLD